jgi:hypothetical protein
MAIHSSASGDGLSEGWPALRIINALLAPIHVAQAIAILVLSTDFKLPINTSFVTMPENAGGPGEGTPNIEKILDVPIGPLVATFLLISAADHLLVSLPRIYPWYKRNLDNGVNYARWWEYAFSSSIMIVIIAMFPGVYDIASIILIASLNAMMIFCGLMMESVNKGAVKEDVNWTPYWFGCFAGAIPWVVIALFLISPGGRSAGDVPAFVYGIFFSLFAFFNCFAINMLLQYKRVGPWRNYIFGEYAYMALSLGAKSALAWQVFSGTLT